MEKELDRPVLQGELFKVTHIKKTTDPMKEKNGLSHVLKRHMRGLCKKFRSIVVPNLWKVKMHHFHKKLQSNLWRESTGEPVRGVVYGYTEKAYHEKKSWFYCSPSSNFNSVD